MKNGTCPKCSSGEIYFSDSSGIQNGLHPMPLLNIYKDNKWVPDITRLEMNYYLCRSCGYLEMSVRETGELSKLDDCTNWRKV